MNILSIETATEACSAALSVNASVTHEYQVAPQKHSQLILPMVDNLLMAAKLEVAQLDYLAFGRGPGSFTGVRIATGVIQGLAMSASIPVVAVSTLETMAQQAFDGSDVSYAVSAIDARMGEVYFAIFERDNNGTANLIGKEQVIAPNVATGLLSAFFAQHQGDFLSVGTGWQTYPDLVDEATQSRRISTDILYPDAQFMLPVAQKMIEQGNTLAVDEIQPVYVRDEVTWKKLPGR